MGFLFRPSEVQVVLHFQYPEGRGQDNWEVAVRRRDGAHLMTRRLNLLAGTKRGNVKDLIDELVDRQVGSVQLLATLLTEACESVLASHRNGRPFQVTEGAIERPPPPAWLCRGLLLKYKANVWLGAASTGKSTLAKAMCAYFAAGYRFCDREMEQGVPLYLDWESDHDDFVRVVYDVCRNLGAYPLPRFVYRGMHGYRLRDQLEVLSRVIDRERVGLVVLDAVAAAGGSTGEHMTWEAVALEMEACLDALPPVTVLCLDHVTGAEHKAGTRAVVPIKARGAERKLEYTRNQWTLMTDEEAQRLGRHVVRWHHTKLNVGALEAPFATEIIHRADEVSIVPRPLEVTQVTEEEYAPGSQTGRLLRVLQATGGRTARELALEIDGREPGRARVESVRVSLERAVKRGAAFRDEREPPRYFCKQSAPEGVLVAFPGAGA